MIKKYNLEPSFELSQNFLFFYDKLEKANYYLNYILESYSTNLETLKSETELGKLINLKYLNCNNNYLIELPISISNLINLSIILPSLSLLGEL